MIRLNINNTMGLTCYDGCRLNLNDKVAKWCDENLGYQPRLNVVDRGMNVWLYFINDDDRLLFQIRYADYWVKIYLVGKR